MDKYPLIRNCLTVGIIVLFIGIDAAPSINPKILIADNVTSATITSNITTYDGTLSGYVSDSEMNPIEGAMVRVYFHNTYRENYSNATGYFHVTDISVCNCTKNATCSKEGYNPAWVYLGIWENTTYDLVLSSKGNWLYVGGDGPGNYTKIQDAINDSVNGDTVFVFRGTYYENIIIDKPITLTGEQKEFTVITGRDSDAYTASIIVSQVGITGFTIRDGYFGIFLNHSSDNSIMGNIISDNKYGIILYHSLSNSITGNEIINNSETGILLRDSSNTNLTANMITDNGLYGITIEYSTDNQIYSNNVSNNHEAGITIWSSSENHIMMNTISNNSDGISLFQSSNNNILSDNIISWNRYKGIHLSDSSDNTLMENIIDSNDHGIYLDESHSNIISNNSLKNNYYEGVDLENSNSNIFLNNTVNGCGFFIRDSYHTLFRDNTINDKPLLYLESKTDLLYDKTEVGQILLVNSTNITIKNLALTNTSESILLVSCTNCVISNSTLTNNWYGIYLLYSFGNTLQKNTLLKNNNSIILMYSDENLITENTVRNNTIGIGAGYSSGNTIFKNTIISNEGNGILLPYCHKSQIADNTIFNNSIGIEVFGSQNIIETNRISLNHESGILAGGAYNEIIRNVIYENQGDGIQLKGHRFGNITRNTITGNEGFGLLLTYYYNFLGYLITGKNNKIVDNNIFNNTNDAFFEFNYITRWDQNYWGKDTGKLYIVPGKTALLFHTINFPWINIDWHPAQEPYDIPG
jgi:parallel beta-helix repeat protein